LSSSERSAEIVRKTRETDIRLRVDLDGQGRSEICTGIGFLDHMLELFARHGLVDLAVTCTGDLRVDGHHTTEDVGICLGQAIDRALGDRAGIRRYGHSVLPMDETLVTAAVDLGGRPYWVWDVVMPTPQIGTFDSELVADFWQAVCTQARMNLHVILHHGRNSHHISEAVFKAVARSLRDACEPDPRYAGVPSTKGTL
jgi:imidazoleglycerol-phosphate dehydratase